MPAANLKGQRFGRLQILERNGSKKYGNGKCSFSVWRCLCDCGNYKDLTSRCLISGKTISCGCAKKETKYPEGKAFARLFASYKSNATRRNIVFSLTDREFSEIISAPCYYTGRPPSRKYSYRGSPLIHYNGIDRKDPSVGYIIGNVVPCCFEINRAKSDLSVDSFLELVNDMARHLNLGEDRAAQTDLVDVVYELRQIVNVKG